MTNMLIESVVMAFVMGGIVGAAIALCLRSSRFWGPQGSDEHLTSKPVPIRSHQRRNR
ncbi:MAG: hypothetical protein ACE5ET_06810 [Gammaproteobacteria bacterium]